MRQRDGVAAHPAFHRVVQWRCKNEILRDGIEKAVLGGLLFPREENREGRAETVASLKWNDRGKDRLTVSSYVGESSDDITENNDNGDDDDDRNSGK